MCTCMTVTIIMIMSMENFLQVLLPEIRLEILLKKHSGTCIDHIHNHKYGSGV